MSHAKDLIEKIKKDLLLQYPTNLGYEYIIEKSICHTRMIPDIQVSINNQTICAVEIGYTRPEKLTAYRNELKIPDVRWYDKSGKLHGDVKEEIRKITIEVSPKNTFYYYEIHNHFSCHDCPGVLAKKIPEKSYKRYVRMFGEDAYLERINDAEEEEKSYVQTIIITDYIRIFFPSFCDKCGECFLPKFEEDELDINYLIDIFINDRKDEIARQISCSRTKILWKEFNEKILEEFNVELNYMDGLLINQQNTYI